MVKSPLAWSRLAATDSGEPGVTTSSLGVAGVSRTTWSNVRVTGVACAAPAARSVRARASPNAADFFMRLPCGSGVGDPTPIGPGPPARGERPCRTHLPSRVPRGNGPCELERRSPQPIPESRSKKAPFPEGAFDCACRSRGGKCRLTDLRARQTSFTAPDGTVRDGRYRQPVQEHRRVVLAVALVKDRQVQLVTPGGHPGRGAQHSRRGVVGRALGAGRSDAVVADALTRIGLPSRRGRSCAARRSSDRACRPPSTSSGRARR